MKSRLRIALLCSLIVLSLAFTGCGKSSDSGKQPQGGAATTAPTASPAGTAQGGTTTTANAAEIAKQNCVMCHGANLDGNGAQNKNLTKIGAKLSKEEIATTITNGRNGMPAFKGKLKDNEIAALADWLAAKK